MGASETRPPSSPAGLSLSVPDVVTVTSAPAAAGEPLGISNDSSDVSPERPFNPRPHWIGIVGGLAATIVAIAVVAIYIHPGSSAGLVALVIAATAFPALALWASRVSSIELVRSSIQSAKARNELIGFAIASLREDIRSSAAAQSRSIVASVDALRAATEDGSRTVVTELRSLGETLTRVSAEQVRAIGEERAAVDRQSQATRELAELQAAAERRAMPTLHAQTQIRPAWLFWRHNWIIVANTAGTARAVVVSYRFLQQNNWARIPVPAFDLAAQQQQEFDLGDIAASAGSNHIWLMIQCRDDAGRRYVANVDLPLGGNNWQGAQIQAID